MHAYLLVGQGITNFQTPISKLAEEHKAKILNFPLAKIEDVRNLNNLLRLSFSEPTLIVSENIEDATEEALNAFLKNLEEPQENIYFALTASSEKKVLPTIVSRCQIIKVQDSKFQIPDSQKFEDFLEMTQSQRLTFFDTIKDRNEAINFIESLIFFLHNNGDLTNMELFIKTLTRLKGNGAVNLHLLNLITQYG